MLSGAALHNRDQSCTQNTRCKPAVTQQSVAVVIRHRLGNTHPASRKFKNSIARATDKAAMQGNSAAAEGSNHLPFLCGLTGSIGMGKSTVSGFLVKQGVPVLCADDVVHKLYAAGGAAVQPVGAAFPTAIVDGAVDRVALSKCVIGNEPAMKQLENIVHPLVEQERITFVGKHASSGARLLVFDIPLLYETKAEAGLDAVVVVNASADVQRARVMARPGMTAEKFEAILARQVSNSEKLHRADYIIDTGCSLEQTEQHVAELVHKLQGQPGKAAERMLAACASQ